MWCYFKVLIKLNVIPSTAEASAGRPQHRSVLLHHQPGTGGRTHLYPARWIHLAKRTGRGLKTPPAEDAESHQRQLQPASLRRGLNQLTANHLLDMLHDFKTTMLAVHRLVVSIFMFIIYVRTLFCWSVGIIS